MKFRSLTACIVTAVRMLHVSGAEVWVEFHEDGEFMDDCIQGLNSVRANIVATNPFSTTNLVIASSR
jgi:uncharacterized membrane protein